MTDATLEKIKTLSDTGLLSYGRRGSVLEARFDGDAVGKCSLIILPNFQRAWAHLVGYLPDMVPDRSYLAIVSDAGIYVAEIGGAD
jgi:hypothetical protein